MSESMRAHVRRLRRLVRSRSIEPHPDLLELTPEDRRYLTSLYDDSTPLPPGAERELRPDNPRLRELRQRYAAVGLPAPSRWNDAAVDAFLDLRYFRGETLFVWHYRELRRVTELKYFLYAAYVRERDGLGLLDRLDEDGAFGCWTFAYPGYGVVSRDLLQSVNELTFLERALGLSRRDPFAVLDVGAGYGRLAHRMAQAFPQLADYCCVDAVPEATLLSDYYLRFRGCAPPGRVVALDRIDAELAPGGFDLAVNVHSFSECPLATIAWWVDRLVRLQVGTLLLVPNDADALLSLEADASRRDFSSVLEDAGYRVTRCEPVIGDPAIRELLRLHDRFWLFELSR
jgi:SAM-dependent methyltransferase